MKLQRTQQQLEVLLRRSEGSSLVDLWLATHYDADEIDIEPHIGFHELRDAFLWALEAFLKEGRIRLHKNGVFLEGSVEEQVQKFRDAWPLSEHDADRICTKPGYEAPYRHFGMNVWWFMDVCPAGVAWRKADGSYQIAD